MSDTTHDSSIPQPPPAQHAPYAPTTASLGGLPNILTDIPITTIFLFLFLLGAITHMTIFQLNKRRGHKFLLSGMLFGFCMARQATCALRIAWACHPTHVPLAIAANIFVSAGVVLLFIINLIFAQRILRAAHPRSAWHPAFALLFTALYGLVVVSLLLLIAVTVLSFYTLNRNTRRVARDIQLYGATYFTLVAFLPIPMVVVGLLIPRATRPERFGAGRFRSKIVILLVAAVLLTLGAAFRTGTSYRAPRPRNNPAWYHSKACFYTFNLLVEILVVLLYAVLRVDLRFHVPNGASKAGDYAAGHGQEVHEKEEETGNGAAAAAAVDVSARIRSEEEVFDDDAGARRPEEEEEVLEEKNRRRIADQVTEGHTVSGA
ncbi:MAG: hypothetical protein M1816_005423 [Peltula sp. TS41687]|nr:MAG: hypothetical protein M1816_005423 [Peltula sp. TS41687]